MPDITTTTEYPCAHCDEENTTTTEYPCDCVHHCR